MKALTTKGVLEALCGQLKIRAARRGGSLNGVALVTLESATAEHAGGSARSAGVGLEGFLLDSSLRGAGRIKLVTTIRASHSGGVSADAETRGVRPPGLVRRQQAFGGVGA